LQSAHLRDQQLLAAGWRHQQASKRFSYNHLAYQSSFGGATPQSQQQQQPQSAEGTPIAATGDASSSSFVAASPANKKPAPVERRYSVAVIGLGIS
jgi:hypothetical protein